MTKPHHYAVGDIQITQIIEHVAPLPAATLFPDHQDEFQGTGIADTIFVSIHSWVVATPRHLMIVDTGIGNGRDRGGNPLFDHLQTPFADRLATAGVDRHAVDTVLMTHLHIDHVGWNTFHDGDRWRPMFPNARYVFSADELEHWRQDPKRQMIFNDSIQPILGAGLAQLVDRGATLALGDGMTHIPTPGHSRDHASITAVSAGEYALFGGDIMHHPIQVAHPKWNSTFCEDKPRAATSRKQALEWCAEHNALYLSSHFAGQSAGRILRTPAPGAGYEWHPA